MKRNKHTGVIIAVVAVVATCVYLVHQYTGDSAVKTAAPIGISPPATKDPAPAPTPAPKAFNATLHPLDKSDSLWVIVNKKRPLQPTSYVPESLVVPEVALRSNITSNENRMRTDAAKALKTMFDAAATTGVKINLQSAYRSYSYQTTLYNGYVQTQGQATADTQSARPGYSEHQTGLAVDVGSTTQPACNIEACFAATAEGKWVAEHAYEYGFVIRYPQGLDAVTGYIYEPWHLRYVGSELSQEVHRTGTATLEQFFKLPAAPSYN